MDCGTVALAQNVPEQFITTNGWTELTLICDFGANDVYLSEMKPGRGSSMGALLPTAGSHRFTIPPRTTLWAICTTVTGARMGFVAVELPSSRQGG